MLKLCGLILFYLVIFNVLIKCDEGEDEFPDVENEIDLDSELSVYHRLNEVFGRIPQTYNKNTSNQKIIKHDNNSDLWDDCISDDTSFNATKEERQKCIEIKKHAKTMKIIRIIGYPLSLSSLLIGILLIIFIKRLHRPRNILHTSLFFAFILRTILTIISVEYSESPTDHLCKLAEFFFRYSGAVYHVAMFAEAFYLVSLLHYPFYTVRVGYKVCICITWFLPLAWMLIWLLAKAGSGVFLKHELCWKRDSLFKLILKIPETFLVFINVILGVLIIKAINSRLCFSKAKIARYKRLAKSYLILMPIMETYFIVFAWSHYIKFDELTLKGAFILNYIESIFYGYQGFMVFLVYALIQRDLRIEFMIVVMKIIKFFSCCCKIENSKLSVLHETQLKSDMAKAYPFHPIFTKLDQRGRQFSKSYTDENGNAEINEELNYLTI